MRLSNQHGQCHDSATHDEQEPGLLPGMNAGKRARGGYTYRYITYDRRYINLGQAIQKVLEMEQRAPTAGTVEEMVRA